MKLMFQPKIEAKIILLIASLFLAGLPAAEAVKLPAVFGNHMVLQREIKAPVWGWAAPGETITVTLAGKKAKTTADSQGEWKVKIGPFPTGGPFDLIITGTNTITLNDVMIGEVWVCSGQSNMEVGLGEATDGAQAIQTATNAAIRLFIVSRRLCLSPQSDCQGQWVVCSPSTVRGFSAVAYYFGQQVGVALNVPIGLIESAHGGSPAEAWTSREVLTTLPEVAFLLPGLDSLQDEFPQFKQGVSGGGPEYALANAAVTNAAQNETENARWTDVSLDTRDWKEMTLPEAWDRAGLPLFYGIVWFRKDVEIPVDWAGKNLTLTLPPINVLDVTWFNGVRIGATGSYGDWKPKYMPRQYSVPGALVKPGRAVITVRVVHYEAGSLGGFWKKGPMQLAPEAGQPAQPLNLAGAWRYHPGPRFVFSHYTPTTLFNGMIHPLVPYGMRGVLWYQGESNSGTRAPGYDRLFAALISDWRTRWGQGDFPFLFVQLPNYASLSSWPEVREAQLKTIRLPHTGMAVAIDVGDPKDIHPKNKAPVGRRLALIALGKVYGKDIVYSGPLYESMTIEGNRIRLKFKQVGGGLVAKGGELKQFVVAGADKNFVVAQAVIDGDTVVVSSPQAPNPVAARYAWAQNPEGCNLYNKEDLPASPFRTDE